jgi:hypothetical protein
MSEQAAPSFRNEVAGAVSGMARLIAHRDDWFQGFDLTARGFVRSFLAQAAALPFYLVTAALVARVSAPAQALPTVWAAGAAHVLDTFSYPLLIALIARPLRLGGGFPAFIVVNNWISLIFNAAMAVLAFFVLLGREGFAVFSTGFLVLFGLSIFLTWRTARETLTEELAPALLVTVLSVAVGVGCDRVGAWLVGLFS